MYLLHDVCVMIIVTCYVMVGNDLYECEMLCITLCMYVCVCVLASGHVCVCVSDEVSPKP